MFVTALTAAFYTLGFLCSRSSSRRVLYIPSLICLFFILIRILFRYFPAVEYSLLPYSFYSHIQAWWVLPFAFFIFGMVPLRIRSAPLRISAEILTGLLFVFYAHAAWLHEPAPLIGRPDKDHVCMQTSGYSCGPAAAVTLLASRGIHTNENEMARLCSTNPVLGTSEYHICSGLAERLRSHDFKPELTQANARNISSLPLPFMAVVKHSFFADHWIVVMTRSGSGFSIADPLSGRIHMTAHAFADRFQGTAVHLITK